MSADSIRIATTPELAQILSCSPKKVLEAVAAKVFEPIWMLGSRPYKFDVDYVLGVVKENPSSLKTKSARSLGVAKNASVPRPKPRKGKYEKLCLK